ncbi:N-acetylglucosamine-6-phosphate deacetylase [Micromonospora noduli]|uniref:N-acetylglucosamine-6-phosphate deacetylase n=1 Tax=Micromonospora noduli TaxID=709876 RepID=A0A328NCN0_9ACTN|nr:N-acetylglucosamine-6-phosphate deacetylase [Micromonospora noduli]KAB1924676.1 N-acetylglucosamine-6-phosphate deacetylase [Micromonospora noduli]RAO04577.1 N-acetylglucosamine-6-phosphate deacetylase [Micromonospora noduli]RAO07625.1 N-acetylglucosamine-6-phosphate deacetylase [Micromonospora noduli]RAO10234.1 N-acetylglucosamine-6-phosphate deacetylase [Micromonospora noduli]RAO23511.1 N-acetylglucosamine-6-phosphate deacetylase [Micromonospora noduli]
MTVRVNGRVVTPTGVVRQGCVEWDGDRITAVAEYPSVRDGHWILPGFVDMHTHGGGGHTFTTGDADEARAAADFHLAHGTTTLLASLVSAPFPLMRTATEAFAPLVDEGVLAGIHFEGPYLSAARCGAQNPEYLRDPSTDELTELIELGRGAIRMVTLAPERDGALEAIKLLTAQRVVTAVGHTDATYEQTRAAVAAGASVGTHLFNGMRPVHHREPGPVVALLDAPTVICELVADGVHLHDGMLTFVTATAGPDRAALITDAMAAAGMPDGEYELGGQAVTVADGVARLARDGAIAGSTLTMDAALRHAVNAGIPIADAARMVATTPARAIGLGDRLGALQVGLRADLVVLDDDLNVVRVLRGGSWVE